MEILKSTLYDWGWFHDSTYAQNPPPQGAGVGVLISCLWDGWD